MYKRKNRLSIITRYKEVTLLDSENLKDLEIEQSSYCLRRRSSLGHSTNENDEENNKHNPHDT